MNELKIFEHPDFEKIRAVAIDDEPYLVGKDVAEVLGYSNTTATCTSVACRRVPQRCGGENTAREYGSGQRCSLLSCGEGLLMTVSRRAAR